MRIAALTMVYRDEWALGQWVAHHSRLIGRENLYVISHGADPRVAEIARGASIITVPRDDLSHFDKRRATLLNGVQNGLLGMYSHVIRTDADELIWAEGGLDACLAQNDAPVLTALGFDVVAQETDAPDREAPALRPGRHVGFTGHYSKACIVSRAHDLVLHGTRVPPRRVAEFPYCLPRGLYLAHLKYADPGAEKAANVWRVEVAGAEGDGLPGPAWQKARADSAKFHRMFAAKREVPWPEARDAAYTALASDPLRAPARGLVKAQGLRFDTRTRLPEGFGR